MYSNDPSLTPKTNIMLVIASISGGGAELVVSNLCKYLDREKFRVCCCHLKERGDRGDELYNTGYDIVGLPNINPSKPNYLSFIKLRRLVREKRIHLLHSHDLHSLIDSSLLKLTYPNVKLIHTFHFGNYPHSSKKYLFLERIFSRVPDQLVAVGDRQKAAISDTFRIDNEKIITIRNGVEAHQGVIENRMVDRFENEIVIGSISTFIKQKGLKHLICAVEKLKANGFTDFTLVLVGDGPLRNEIKSLCKQKHLLDHVVFTGWVKNAYQKILPRFDIFVQSSLWEAMSMVILEAMAAEKPIIATDVGENRYVIDQGRNGLIVKPGNAEMLFQSIKKLINNEELRMNLGKNARKKYLKKFTVIKMAKKYGMLYQHMANKLSSSLRF